MEGIHRYNSKEFYLLTLNRDAHQLFVLAVPVWLIPSEFVTNSWQVEKYISSIAFNKVEEAYPAEYPRTANCRNWVTGNSYFCNLEAVN